MTARIILLTGAPTDDELIAAASVTIRHGGLVAFPTETVYGLGANAFDEAAVARIFEAKQRPRHDPLIVHVHPSWSLDLVFDRTDSSYSRNVERLAAEFWPGPLTLVAPSAAAIPALVTSGRPTVAVRAPAHPVAAALLDRAGVPIAAPSANRFGYVSPTTARHVLDDLATVCDTVIDGGPSPVGIESTVVLVEHTRLVLLRPGAVAVEALASAVPDIDIVLPGSSRDATLAPGGLDSHYAPTARTIAATPGVIDAVRRDRDLWPTTRRGVLVGLEPLLPLPPGWQVVVLGAAGDLAGAAHRLYGALRQLDADQPSVVVVVLTGRPGLGEAIDDRLRRAAHGRVATTVAELAALVGSEAESQ